MVSRISLMLLVTVMAAGGGASAAPASKALDSEVTFSRDVLPILQRSCQDCHRPEGLNMGGMVAPMSLVTYQEARPWAKTIARVVKSGEMPPWHASEAQRGLFTEERYLDQTEIDTLVRWAQAGAPEGDPADAPAPLAFEAQGGWHIGEPDLVLKMPADYCVPDEVEDEYQYFRQQITEDQLPEDRWIKAVEFKPTGQFVHHIIARPLGGIAPGYSPRINPPGHGKLLRKGTEITWQMHYHKEPGAGSSVCDTDTYVALRFYEPGEVITHVVRGDSLAVRGFEIPPNDPNYSGEAEYTFTEDSLITGFNPHMHLRGKAAKVTAHFPDGSERLLLDVPRYDFDWQHNYWYNEPVPAPAGTRVHLTLWWDNSPDNPSNPDPEATVTFGQPTTAEMGFGFMKYIDAKPTRIVVGETTHSETAESGGE